jgi:hypothetical protein
VADDFPVRTLGGAGFGSFPMGIGSSAGTRLRRKGGRHREIRSGPGWASGEGGGGRGRSAVFEWIARGAVGGGSHCGLGLSHRVTFTVHFVWLWATSLTPHSRYRNEQRFPSLDRRTRKGRTATDFEWVSRHWMRRTLSQTRIYLERSVRRDSEW